MTRTELIAYLEHKADAFEGHPVHVDMSDALREAIHYMKADDALYFCLTPLPLSSGPLPRVPDDK